MLKENTYIGDLLSEPDSNIFDRAAQLNPIEPKLTQDQIPSSTNYSKVTIDSKSGKAFEVLISEIKNPFQNPKQTDRKSTRLNSSHIPLSRMPSSA